jgi:hypothetical protein
MDISVKVVGVTNNQDPKFKQMFAAYQACEAANVEIPDAVIDYFNDEEPNPKGLEVTIPVKKSSGEMKYFYDFNVSELPKDVESIRVVVDFD